MGFRWSSSGLRTMRDEIAFKVVVSRFVDAVVLHVARQPRLVVECLRAYVASKPGYGRVNPLVDVASALLLELPAALSTAVGSET
jgi:hypothetical protein